MRILIAVVNFRFLTGAELYVYELSRSLAARGHEVTVVSQTGGEIAERARAHGVRVCSYRELPADAGFDVMHVQELRPARWAMNRFPDTPAIATVPATGSSAIARGCSRRCAQVTRPRSRDWSATGRDPC